MVLEPVAFDDDAQPSMREVDSGNPAGSVSDVDLRLKPVDPRVKENRSAGGFKGVGCHWVQHGKACERDRASRPSKLGNAIGELSEGHGRALLQIEGQDERREAARAP